MLQHQYIPTIYNGRLKNQYPHFADSMKEIPYNVKTIVGIELIIPNTDQTILLQIHSKFKGHDIIAFSENYTGEYIIIKLAPSVKEHELDIFDEFIPVGLHHAKDYYVDFPDFDEITPMPSPTPVAISKELIAAIKRNKY